MQRARCDSAGDTAGSPGAEGMTLADEGGEPLLRDIRRARGFLGRGLGWMGRRRPSGNGLWIEPCGSMHTCFMRFPLDVVFLSREGRVLRLVRGLRPWRIAFGGSGARIVLETPAGTLPPERIRIGMEVRLVPGSGVRVQPMSS